MKTKVETPAQKEKRLLKEARQLSRLEKEKLKPKNHFYLVYIIMILALIQIVDEVTSSITSQMQAEIAVSVFGDKLSIMTALSALALPMMAVVVFYKALSDKFGRKPFLVINTCGMGLALFVIFLAGKFSGMNAIVVYVFGTVILNFFIPNDTQVLYIMEVAPKGKRTTIFAVVKSIAMLGVFLIPLMRRIFMGDDSSRWNYVYLVPAIIAFAVAFIALLCVKESDVFIDNRIAYLKMTDAERAAEAEKKSKEAEAEGGLGNALKFAFSHKQLRWLFIINIIFGIGAMGVNYYEKIADIYYSTDEVTSVLMMFSIASALITFMNGVLADRLGRKATVVTTTSVCFASFVLFYLGCVFSWNPYVTGVFIGLYYGGFYAANDLIQGVMSSESAPTNLRASVMSADTIMSMIGKILAMLVPMAALFITHDNYSILGNLCIFGSIPALGISLFLLITKVGDTTGIDLNTVRGDEWDSHGLF